MIGAPLWAMAFHLLRNAIQEYDWGSHTALAELQGRPAPSPVPEAELWIGAHPRAPSEVRVDGGWRSLRTCIAAAPARWLGASAGAGELPFLLKVLAAERPLSLQLHPDAAAARRGFEREERAGIALEDPARCYPDPNPKSELLCALTPFEGLCGLLERGAAAEGATRAGLRALATTLAAERLPGEIFMDLLARPEAAAALLEEALAVDPGDHAALSWVARLAAAHPGDPSALAPLFMNRLLLAPGQAVFLRPGRLHGYLRGVGVELMANSDNVLRAGLTTKHVDLDELREVMELGPSVPELLEPAEGAPGEWRYPTESDAFALSVLRPRGGEVAPEPAGGAEILLCTAGRAEIRSEDGAEAVALERGAALFVSAGPAYRVCGDATVYRAAPGRPAPA